MKPEWKDAPEWANYRAMDADGAWYWHEYEPFLVGSLWRALTGRYKYCNNKPKDWRETKESRPAFPQVSRNEKPC